MLDEGFPCDEDEPELELTFASSLKKNRGEPSASSTKASQTMITPEYTAEIELRLAVEKARQDEILSILPF